jgi:hypothetical protein
MPGVTTEGRTGMGLSGRVMCGCFKQGRVKEPPVPLEWLHIDEEGNFNLRPAFDSDENFFKVSDWMQTACPHPDFTQAREHVANWPGYGAFQQALGRVGYPTLQSDLPEANGGLTLSSAAAIALKELALFRSLPEVGKDTFLVATATGEVLHRHIAASEGVFLYGADGRPRAGVNSSHFFVEDPATRAILFRSVCFRQTRVAAPSGEDLVLLEDLDGGGSYCGPVAVQVLPAELHVETRVVKPADFDHILGPLETLFKASVESGNPVRWS